MLAICEFLTSKNSFIPTLKPLLYVNPTFVMPGVPGRMLHKAFSSDTTVSSCTTDPIWQKETAPLLKPVPTNVTIEPPRDGPVLGRMSTISARGERIMGMPPDSTGMLESMMLRVILLEGSAGSVQTIWELDRYSPMTTLVSPNRQPSSWLWPK